MEALAGALTIELIISKVLGLLDHRAVQFTLIAVVFIPLERLVPFHAGQRLFRRYFGLDLLHYFVGGVFIIVFVWLTYRLMPTISAWVDIHPAALSVRDLPWWGQILVFEAGWTFLGYWLHRFEHVWLPLWRLHSIHESSKELDWLSAFRLHPLEPALFQVLTVVPLWFFGMDLPVAIGYKVYSYVFAHIQHSNIVLPIGPLKYVLPTPQFHRWHHACVYDADGRRQRSFCNFSQYPLWDQLFGTFYLPDMSPTAYGNARNVPMDYLAQLAYPFGGHQAVLAWQRSLSERLQLSGRIAAVRAAIAPAHDALEDRLARLSLLRPASNAGSAFVAKRPIAEKEVS